MLNNTGPRYKRSKLEKDINIDVIAQVVILVALCLVGAIGEWVYPVNAKVWAPLSLTG